MAKRHFELVERIDPRFVNARVLACRTHVHSCKEVGKRRMILPKGDHAAQHVRTPQDGTILDGRAAQSDMTPAPSRQMRSIIAKFSCDKTMPRRLLGKYFVKRLKFVPLRRGWHVDFEHTWIRRETEDL